LKSYKKRYSKKRGLKKLDCYYENKLFNKFLHLYEIAQKIKNEKKRSKYFFFKKYDIVLFLLSLLPVIGLIHPILFGLSHKYPGILGACEESHIETNYYTGLAYMIVSLIIVSVVLFVVIYILLKLIKYQRLKSGRGKMNINQYYHLCKGIF
ncbi:variable surface protein Vir11, truncated, putative, partial [Plasmodium vivax]